MTERIETGRFYRILADKTNNVWNRLSFWKKASDVEFDDGSNLENNKPIGILKRRTEYKSGDIAYTNATKSWIMLKCTQRGTTGSSLPSDYATKTVGSTVTDGTAVFALYDVRPCSDKTQTPAAYYIPAMSIVYDLYSQLTANGQRFHFDYNEETGQYGYNLNGDHSTFVPF